MHDALIAFVGRKLWWHVPPLDENAYSKRGKFYSSTYSEAEFYGRPNNGERVKIERPFVCDNATMETTLLGAVQLQVYSVKSVEGFVQARRRIDARIKKTARKRGFDSIVLMSDAGYKLYTETGKIPRSIELNILTY